MDEMSVKFQKVIDVTKAYEDDGHLFIEGESSGPEFDLDKQFMTPECVKNMAEQVNKKPVPFGYYDEHNKRGVLSELGEVVEASVTPEYHMKTRVRLDRDNPAATLLWKKIKQGKQYGMSIAGHVVEPVKKLLDGVVFQGFNRIRLDHIANTTKPSWSPSLGTLVAKSLEQDGFDWETAPEYEGDLELPFSAHVEKRSKPDPQAGKWYTLAADILNRLNTVFGWESYQDKIDETNRDIIPFKDLPLAAKLPVGAVELSADDYDADPEGYIEKMDAMVAEPEQGPMDVRNLAELYERLYFLAESLGRRDATNGTKDGKKTITRLKAAMKAVADAMREMLSKAQPPEPLTYGEEPEQPEPVQKMQEETTMQEGDNVLKDFADAATVGQKPVVPQQPQPSVEGGALTDFSQVADVALPAPQPQPVAKAETPEDLNQLLGEFGEAVQKAFDAEAPVDSKREALAYIVKAFVGELGGKLESQRPEEERIEKAVAPLESKIEQLQAQIERLTAQLAVSKSQPQAKSADVGGEQPLVRKSLPGRNVVLQPARYVEKSDRKPTFVDLVTGQGGLLQ